MLFRIVPLVLVLACAATALAADEWNVSVTYLVREMPGGAIGRVAAASSKLEGEVRAALSGFFADPSFGTPSQGEKLAMTCKGSLKNPDEAEETVAKLRAALANLARVGTDTWALLNELRVVAGGPGEQGAVRINVYISPHGGARPTAAEWVQFTNSVLEEFQVTAGQHLRIRGLLLGLGSNTMDMEIVGAARSGQDNAAIEAAIRGALEAKLAFGYTIEKMKVATE